MKAILLHNWRAKFTSLLLAIAIWFLIRLSIQDQLPPEIPVPGEAPTLPSIKIPPPVPGLPGTIIGGRFSAAREEIVMVTSVSLYRLHWIEAGNFEASLVEYPPRAIV
jgi:hypothetical protein